MTMNIDTLVGMDELVEWSDDDERHDWSTFELRFGKYKGTTLNEMIKTQRKRGYLRYILQWDDIRPATASAVKDALAVHADMKRSRHARNMSSSEPFTPLTQPTLSRQETGR